MTTITCPRCGTSFETAARTNTRCRSCKTVVRVAASERRAAEPPERHGEVRAPRSRRSAYAEDGSAPATSPSGVPKTTATEQAPGELAPDEIKLVGELLAVLVIPSILLSMLNATDAMIVKARSDKLVTTLVLCSRRNRRLHRLLLTVVLEAVWLQLGAAVLDIVGPILDNHGIVSIPGLRVSDVLSTPASKPGPLLALGPGSPADDWAARVLRPDLAATPTPGQPV